MIESELNDSYEPFSEGTYKRVISSSEILSTLALRNSTTRNRMNNLIQHTSKSENIDFLNNKHVKLMTRRKFMGFS